MNEKQEKAVKQNGNVLVIAGAGSGKTYTIVKKINYLIENNIYKPNEILVISFTNESVNDLKRKINHDLKIYTFHKLAITLLNDSNYKIIPNNYLEYIIDEFFETYTKLNKKTNKSTIKNTIYTFINLYKSNYININKLINLYKKSLFINKDYFLIILAIYKIYENELNSSNTYDFNDLIIKATTNIENNLIQTNYKYIIIDEFQDTSQIRFNLIHAILKQNNGNLFVVGDDYQSIYRFSGCNLDIFLNIKRIIKDLTIINLDYNYRNSKEIITVANTFIMKNKKQIPKNTICLKNINKPIKIYYYNNEKTIVNRILNNINTNYLILGRNNKDKTTFNIKENFLTIHKSKGLEEENIILVNLQNNNTSIPTKIINHKIIDKIILKDAYPYEEERRLFYVALTRTKNYIHMAVPYNNKSIFIKELLKNYKDYIEIIK